jgi:hypothetical protein
MDKYLHAFLPGFILSVFILMSDALFGQIYVGAWNPIRYPNTGVCGWAFQDNGAAGTVSDPYASIEHALKVAELNGTANQTIYLLPDAYVQRYDYDSIPALDRDNCDGHDLDYSPTVGSALSGLQIIGSSSGCLTFLDAIGTSNALSFLNLSGTSNITISDIYFKGYSQAVSINNSSNVTFINCVFEGCNYGVTALDAILINSTASNTSVTFSGCKFIDNNYNTTTNAINIQSNSLTPGVFTAVTFEDCEFVCNQKDNGGGSVFINGRTISDATPTTVNFTGGVFANNKATSSAGRGGALYIGNNCKVNIDGTSFFNNSCLTSGVSSPNDGGGAIYIFSNNTDLDAAARTDVSITNALFYGNKTTGVTNGGAIALIGVSGHTNANRPRLTVTNSIFDRNRTSTAAKGGAIFTSYGELAVSNSTFRRDTSGTGGAIAVENATSVFTLATDSFISNAATTGADVFTDVDFANSTNYFSSINNVAGIPFPPFPAIDRFNRVNNATVGNGWTQVSGSSSVLNNHLRLGNTNDAWVSRTPAGYPATLTNGTDSVSWAFNYYSAATTASRKGYFVLACSNSNFNAATANGYAVVFSTAGVKLISFTGGVKAANSILINGSALAGGQTASVKVVYNPLNDSWRLFDKITSGDALGTDPRTGVTHRGTVTNTAYTNVNLNNHGSFWTPAGGTFSSTIADFDEIYQSVGAGIGTGSGIPFIDAATLVSSYDCNNGYCAAQVAATCLSNQLSDFICTRSDATGSISGIAFSDVNGNGLSDENVFLDDIYIILYDAGNNVIARHTTNTGGTYTFSGLPSGTYKVAFTPKPTLPLSTLQHINPGNLDSDIDNTFFSMSVIINTSLSNTVSGDEAIAALHHQNVSAGFTWLNLLPLELVSFKAGVRNCNEVDLNWETLSEFNVAYFEILKGEDVNAMSPAGEVMAAGNNGSAVNAYQYRLLQNNKVMYYRLKIVDHDMSYAFSPILSVYNNCITGTDLDLTVYPNPTSGFMELKFNIDPDDKVTVSVLNLLGNNILENKYKNTKETISLDLQNLPAGNYVLLVKAKNKVIFKKIEKI